MSSVPGKCQELGYILPDLCNVLHHLPLQGETSRLCLSLTWPSIPGSEASLLYCALSSLFPCAGAKLWTLSTNDIRVVRSFTPSRTLSSATSTIYSIKSLYTSTVLLKIGFGDFLHLATIFALIVNFRFKRSWNKQLRGSYSGDVRGKHIRVDGVFLEA